MGIGQSSGLGVGGTSLQSTPKQTAFPAPHGRLCRGIIVTGLISERLIDALGVHNLLFVAVGGFMGTTVLLLITLRRFREELVQGASQTRVSEPASRAQIPSIYRNHYLAWIFGFVIASAVVIYLLEFIFIRVVNVRYQDIQAYAGFLAPI